MAGFVTVLAVSCASLLAISAPTAAATATAKKRDQPPQRLIAAITKLGSGAKGDDPWAGAPVLRQDKPLVVHGMVTNASSTTWLNAKAFLHITPDPATTLAGLASYARVSAADVGSIIDTYGLFAQLGDLAPGTRTPFKLTIPYDDLGIVGDPGVYRVDVVVFAGPDSARVPVHTSTLMPLLPADPAAAPIPVQTVTLLPLTAPVKSLTDGVFADDSLRVLISAHGRLDNVLDWLQLATPGSVQVVVDPALLAAVTDMSDGYRVKPLDPTQPEVPGRGQIEAQAWLLKYEGAVADQRVMYLPWGVPAANSLLANGLPGPVVSAVDSSTGYQQAHPKGAAVAGWLTNGSSGIRAVTRLHHTGVDLQIVSQASLPGLDAYVAQGRQVPSQVTITGNGRHIPVLVTATRLAGLVTLPWTSALQFRQRLLADATVRALAGDTETITVTALPFTWNPGAIRPAVSLSRAFDLPVPVVVPQSVIGALDRPGTTTYSGQVRASSLAFHALSTPVIKAIHALRLSAGDLAAILSPSVIAERQYQRLFAMSGSAQWRVFPKVGTGLILERASAARTALVKVRVTGPPFVAMSSNSGRFPLTVTNGLDRPITVTIAVTPEDPALRIGPIDPITIAGHQQRDLQVVTTATGSGVTSVRARLSTPDGSHRFGKAWRFDVRSTQIGLVIWIVMGVGGVILFGAAGYRIVNRIRGRESHRRQALT